MIAIE